MAARIETREKGESRERRAKKRMQGDKRRERAE
jgi:hypothetical protein